MGQDAPPTALFASMYADSIEVPNCDLPFEDRVVQRRNMAPRKLQLWRVPRSRLAKSTSGISAADRQQVAAVCFRILSTDVEFLLVRTRRGRWTFPKGGVQSDLSHAQSAAIEAYEEAGVHGRIEEVAFTRYKVRKTSANNVTENSIRAHLCEVLRLEEPIEANRNPTWFISSKAKRRLAEGRTQENSSELSRVVDRAVMRIRRFPAQMMMVNDSLLKVRFEAAPIGANSSTTCLKMRETDPVLSTQLRLGSDLTRTRAAKILQLRPSPNPDGQ